MLERAAAILDAVGPGLVSASEIARRTGLSASTTHRLALSLVDYGFLGRGTEGGFHMGARFERSSQEYAATPVLADLSRTAGEAVQLWVRSGGERGWAESVGLRTPGLGSVSAPVLLDGAAVAAVCVALPLVRVRDTPGGGCAR